jgi:hypothetical protein
MEISFGHGHRVDFPAGCGAVLLRKRTARAPVHLTHDDAFAAPAVTRALQRMTRTLKP